MTQAQTVLRILVVEDDELMRDCICDILSADLTLKVVGATGDGIEAISLVAMLEPDLVTVDWNLPGLLGPEVSRAIRRILPSCRIVFVTLESGPEHVEEAFCSGASGYVAKTNLREYLLPTIHSVASGLPKSLGQREQEILISPSAGRSARKVH